MFPKRKQEISFKDQRRLICVALFLLFLFSLLIIQFFRIQIVQHEKWNQKAYAQHTTVVKEPFRRGVFYANHSIKKAHPSPPQPLVIDVPKFHLFIDPKSVPEGLREEIASRFASMLQLDAEEQSFVRKQFEYKARCRKIARWIDTEVKDEIEQWWRGFAKQKRLARNAIFFIKDYQRSYPFGKMLGQVLHTVRDLRDEKTEQCIPTGGLEYVFNKQLQGKPGKRLFYRSPRHSMDVGKVVDPPQDGADVYLTINHCLQAIAEEEIEKQVLKSEAKRGWALMMDPNTGEVLALAQYPFFYPNQYQSYFNDEEKLLETQVKAVTDPYEPGSTMKAITAAVGLLANEELIRQGRPPLFDPTEMISVKPTLFPGRARPIKDMRTHKYMNMYMAIQKSSNVYVAHIIDRVIQEMGEQWYRNVLQNVFGFGKKTGIELPGESGGLVPTPGKVHPNGALEWSKQTPYTLAMGHNITANSFQMLRAYAILANGGYDVKPTLIRKVSRSFHDRPEDILLDHRPQFDGFGRKRILPQSVVDEVKRAMQFVTKPGGAALKGGIHGYSEAGKTSTSEKIVGGVYSKKVHISTFIGFAPAQDPRFVLMIVIDEPTKRWIPGVGSNQLGGNCAAPAFRRIGRRALEYLGVEPDDPYGYPIGDPRRDPEKTHWNAEVNALKKLYTSWND